MTQVWRNPETRDLSLIIEHAQLITAVSESAIFSIVSEEVFKAIHEDEDYRILIRELVRDAISRMNLQEVVAQAVALALAEQTKPTPT